MVMGRTYGEGVGTALVAEMLTILPCEKIISQIGVFYILISHSLEVQLKFLPESVS